MSQHEADMDTAKRIIKSFNVFAKEFRAAMEKAALALIRIRGESDMGTEAMATLRYRMRLAGEKELARRYLRDLVRETRADIRARGLDIPKH